MAHVLETLLLHGWQNMSFNLVVPIVSGPAKQDCNKALPECLQQTGACIQEGSEPLLRRLGVRLSWEKGQNTRCPCNQFIPTQWQNRWQNKQVFGHYPSVNEGLTHPLERLQNLLLGVVCIRIRLQYLLQVQVVVAQALVQHLARVPQAIPHLQKKAGLFFTEGLEA
jgi:hypothetical protein